MATIKENFLKIKKQIIDTAISCNRGPQSVKLIIATKKKSIDTMMKGIQAGALNIGENYIQEAVKKIDAIGKDKVCWHFIGHLQANKAKLAVKYFEYIHTVDKIKLAREIDRQAGKINKIQKILLQINIGEEKTKSGSGIKDAVASAREISRFENLSLRGLMCIPPYSADPEKTRKYFEKTREIKDQIINAGIASIKHLSMGMSNDFRVAIEEGATMVRIGTSILGRRD